MDLWCHLLRASRPHARTPHTCASCGDQVNGETLKRRECLRCADENEPVRGEME